MSPPPQPQAATAPSSSQKRKRPGPGPPSRLLADAEGVLYEMIKSKEGNGMSMMDMKRERRVPEATVTKSLKALEAKGMVKLVVNIHNKSRKHYMAAGFEASSEVTGGSWYVDGSFDTEYIQILRDQCCKHVQRLGPGATADGIYGSIMASGVFKELKRQQVAEVVRSLVYDDELAEVTGGAVVSYRCTGRGRGLGPKLGGLASIPCGVCPHLRVCTPAGAVNPTTCVYYTQWLNF